ncbi:MAG: glycolate oxidase subunit GlcE [Burkholderiales bacterium]
MSAANDTALQHLIDRVRDAQARQTPLCIRGHGSKDFYGETPQGERLSTLDLRGISSYEPTELVVTVRAGTPLLELEAALAEKGQCLPFEPPRFGNPGVAGTVGGMVAAGLAGPARAAVGSVRDHVLGLTLLNGRGEVLSFGGQVMKNVAGYDVSRLMTGALGTLGVILEVSLKVLPVAPATTTLRFDLDQAAALAQINAWGREPLPINSSCWTRGQLWLRLSGAAAAVQSASTDLSSRLGGQVVDAPTAQTFWLGLRDHTHDYFTRAQTAVAEGASLWRLSLPATAPALVLPGATLVEWGGAQRWLLVEKSFSSTSPAQVREAAAKVGGHAVLFRALDKTAGVFSSLPAPLARIHRELKISFDPARVFNPGRLYPDL